MAEVDVKFKIALSYIEFSGIEPESRYSVLQQSLARAIYEFHCQQQGSFIEPFDQSNYMYPAITSIAAKCILNDLTHSCNLL